jgi:hypothetical protein
MNEMAVRFERLFQPEPNSGCWLWTGAVSRQGYGAVSRRIDGKRITLAHRYSWTIHRGSIPDGAQVLHRCDTPGCVNPDHLFLGDNAANVADKIAKGRSAVMRGFLNSNAKLTVEDVLAIRADPRPAHQVAAEYGVKRVTIAAIRSGRNWSHLS